MFTVDLYACAITQAFTRWFQNKFHRDNYWLSSRFLFVSVTLITLISVFRVNSFLIEENPDHTEVIVIQSILAAITFISLLGILMKRLWEPFILATSQKLFTALDSGKSNPMILGRRVERLFVYICILISIVIPIIVGEYISLFWPSLMTVMLISFYLSSVEPLPKTK